MYGFEKIYSVHRFLQVAHSVAFVHSTEAHALELGEAHLPQLQEIRTGGNVSHKKCFMKVGTSYLKMLIKLPFSCSMNHCYVESEGNRLETHFHNMQNTCKGLKSQGKYLSGAIGV